MKNTAIIKILMVLTVSMLMSCSQKKDTKNNMNNVQKPEINTLEKYRSVFEGNVIALFNEGQTDLNSNSMNFQSYIDQQDIEFIPIFTSKEKFLKSTGGASLGSEIELNGFFFLSFISKSDSNKINDIRLNPSLNDDTYLKIDQLKEYYQTEIQKEIKTMSEK